MQKTKVKSHIQRQREQSKSNLAFIAAVCELTEIDLLVLRHDLACLFLETKLKRDSPQGENIYWELVGSREFWYWWNNEFNQFVNTLIMELRKLKLSPKQWLTELSYLSKSSATEVAFYNNAPLH